MVARDDALGPPLLQKGRAHGTSQPRQHEIRRHLPRFSSLSPGPGHRTRRHQTCTRTAPAKNSSAAHLKTWGSPRDAVVLASKVYFNDGALSVEAIAREIDGTLTRIGTDYLDLYIIHRFDYSTPIEDTMEALDSLVKAGKV